MSLGGKRWCSNMFVYCQDSLFKLMVGDLFDIVNSPDCFFVFSDRLSFIITIIIIVIVIAVIIIIIIIMMVVLGI